MSDSTYLSINIKNPTLIYGYRRQQKLCIKKTLDTLFITNISYISNRLVNLDEAFLHLLSN